MPDRRPRKSGRDEYVCDELEDLYGSGDRGYGSCWRLHLRSPAGFIAVVKYFSNDDHHYHPRDHTVDPFSLLPVPLRVQLRPAGSNQLCHTGVWDSGNAGGKKEGA